MSRRSDRGAGRRAGVPVASCATWLAAPCLLAVAWASIACTAAEVEPGAGETRPPGQALRAEPAAPTRPDPVPLAEIGPRLERDRSQLRRFEGRIQRDPAVVAIESEAPPLFEAVDAQLARISQIDHSTLPPRMVEDLRRQTERWSARLERWQEELSRRAGTLQRARQELQQLRGAWQATLDETGGLPDSLRPRVESMLRAIGDVESRLGERLEHVLDRQAAVAERNIALAETRGELAAGRARATRELFSRRGQPLWRLLADHGVETRLGDELRRAATRRVSSLATYFAEGEARALVHAAMVAGLVVLVLAARRWSRRWREAGEPSRTAATLLARPASAALLVGLLLTPWFYPRAPVALYELMLLVLLLPLLRLLPDLLVRSMRLPLYGLTGLFVLDRLSRLVVEHALLDRLLLLVTTALSLAAVVALLRPGGRLSRIEGGGRGLRAMSLALQAAGVVLVVSLIANVLGFVHLARLLGEATLNSAYFAVVLFAGALVLGGLARLLLHGPGGTVPGLRVGADRAVGGVDTALKLVAVVLWGWATLATFRVLEPVAARAADVFGLSWTVGSITVSIGGVLAFALAVWLAVLASRVVRFLLSHEIFPRVDLPRGAPASISRVVHYVLMGLGLVIALAAAGIDVTHMTLILGALGVGIGFGLQNLVNNFVSGLILIFERPIHVGDVIEIGPLLGEVRDIGIRASVVGTYEGAEVIVPNGELISTQVINWTLSNRMRRIEVKVGVAYGTDVGQVLELLLEQARRHPDVLAEPAPAALFREFGESSLNFALRCWTDNFDKWLALHSELNRAVNDALRAAGITIPFPQRTLHIERPRRGDG